MVIANSFMIYADYAQSIYAVSPHPDYNTKHHSHIQYRTSGLRDQC